MMLAWTLCSSYQLSLRLFDGAIESRLSFGVGKTLRNDYQHKYFPEKYATAIEIYKYIILFLTHGRKQSSINRVHQMVKGHGTTRGDCKTMGSYIDKHGYIRVQSNEHFSSMCYRSMFFI